jgi:hypothetical protein
VVSVDELVDALWPTLAAHQAKTTRQFPVFMLTRQG